MPGVVATAAAVTHTHTHTCHRQGYAPGEEPLKKNHENNSSTNPRHKPMPPNTHKTTRDGDNNKSSSSMATTVGTLDDGAPGPRRGAGGGNAPCSRPTVLWLRSSGQDSVSLETPGTLTASSTLYFLETTRGLHRQKPIQQKPRHPPCGYYCCRHPTAAVYERHDAKRWKQQPTHRPSAPSFAPSRPQRTAAFHIAPRPIRNLLE